ncbi:fimbrial protein [Burkholderia seminalis]|uniref:fimbrial protein n=1 Tax=Burkholderia seminalis TaxID=488731 RepID=UPI001454230C|nr:fimbrial protein [Burkholderia seminalis]MCA8435268.1 type 1 fimbrial protein [Burkholderia seminalis]VWC11552.1 fimbrial protein [Burkholderia seminalis]
MKLGKLLAGLATAGLVVASHGAFAADGTITFNGQITAQTCTINGNGTGSSNFTVTLPTVSTSSLSSAGKTAGRTPFEISLTNCTPNSGNVHVYFEPGPTTDLSTGYLSGTGVTNLELGLLNGDFSQINAGYADANQNSKAVAINSGSANLQYYVQYVAVNGASGTGNVTTSVMYTLAYN